MGLRLLVGFVVTFWFFVALDVESLFPWHYRPLLLLVTALWLWIASRQVLANAGIDLSSLIYAAPELQHDQTHMKHADSDPDLDPAVQKFGAAVGRKERGGMVGVTRYMTSIVALQVSMFHVFANATSDFTDKSAGGIIPINYFMSMSLVLTVVLLLVPWYRNEVKAFSLTIYSIVFQHIQSKVSFLDILLADILTSFSREFGDVLLASCSLWMYEPCGNSMVLQLIIGIPYFIRLRQCISEMLQSKMFNYTHFFNALKYFSIVPVLILNHLIASSSNEKDSVNYFPVWTVFVILNSVYSFIWDIIFDWDLGYWRYGLLRSRLMIEPLHFNILKSERHLDNTSAKISPKLLYYFMIIFNLCARFSWLLRLMMIKHQYVSSRQSHMFVLQFVELLRRFLWLIFRCERQFIDSKTPDILRL